MSQKGDKHSDERSREEPRGDRQRDERSREQPTLATKDRRERGIWIGVDVGTVRVGVARSDPRGVLATPVATLARDAIGNRDIAQLAELVREFDAVGVVVGLPRTLADREGSAAVLARDYGTALAKAISPVPVRHVDERLTTVSAQRKLSHGGLRGRATRAVIDQVAAVELLQHWLDTNRQ